jgi:mRNA-decapping enzyme subunit 2
LLPEAERMEVEEDLGPPPSLPDVLDDLAIRFVVNCPAEEQESFERLLFQVEAAFWFYDDQYREIWPASFPHLNLLGFAEKLFSECVLLTPFASKTKEIYETFTRYKNRIPTCGAIILNQNSPPSKVLLVKAWNGKNWGFPKGKIDRDEDKADCAIREVREEIGYDIAPLLVPEHFVERQLKEQTVRLYIIRGVAEDTEFVTQTKKEIGGIEWHKLKDLPTGKMDVSQLKEQGKLKYWMVAPFVDRLLPWLAQMDKKAKRAAKAGKNAQPAKQKAEAPAAAPPRKKADKADKRAAAPAAATLQVLQRPEGAALKRPPRGHAFLDFEFKTHAVLAALD